ncbi:hypothetical protein F441_10527 [Phytophthora nicotianae CJ01A1]|uniref:Uncharacterized protein n=2 Tax=Phytophthora nicotianae TaxID=4792 RepID=V9EZM9_PHYNI|nr:hypothetical protein F443_10584 [Phytophthora nicotianae P1569]ETP14545.1 hypothetical protein F441_10527 [Phytophthora nicotianae CJ01A1]
MSLTSSRPIREAVGTVETMGLEPDHQLQRTLQRPRQTP